MKRKGIVLIVVIALILSMTGGCALQTKPQDEPQDSALYQVSTLQALIVGAYDGEVTAEQLMEYGDSGLGTFDDLDGEMIVVDGKVYKARVDGSVTEVEADETIPFANVAFLTANETGGIRFSGGYDGLKAALDDMFPEQNMPVLFSISGDFTNIEYRSVPEQQEPFPPLTEVVKEQVVFNKEAISGTIVGFRFPDFLNDINATGFHLHFISDDRQNGGHLLEVEAGEAMVSAQYLDELTVVFPDNIKDVDMSGTSEDDVKTVESKQG